VGWTRRRPVRAGVLQRNHLPDMRSRCWIGVSLAVHFHGSGLRKRGRSQEGDSQGDQKKDNEKKTREKLRKPGRGQKKRQDEAKKGEAQQSTKADERRNPPPRPTKRRNLRSAAAAKTPVTRDAGNKERFDSNPRRSLNATESPTGISHVIESDALQSLTKEIERYGRRELAGRSF